MVGEIDKRLSSVVGVTHAWARVNWNRLALKEKIAWVSARKSLMAEYHLPKDSIDMILSLQRVDHIYRDGDLGL
jgi:hypothetical protein